MHPCKECIIMPVCSKECDKLATLTIVGLLLSSKNCPDCGNYMAPIPKIFFNKYTLKCLNCGHKFNMNGFKCLKRIMR